MYVFLINLLELRERALDISAHITILKSWNVNLFSFFRRDPYFLKALTLVYNEPRFEIHD